MPIDPDFFAIIVTIFSRPVIIIIGGNRIDIIIYLESQAIHVAFIVHVDHGIAFGCNGHILIVFFQMEAGVLFGNAVDPGVSVIAGAGVGHAGDRPVDGAGEGDRFFEVIAVTEYILFPDQYCITSFGYGSPLSVDGGEVTYRTAEYKLITCAGSVKIPAAEGISKADHFFVITGFFSHFVSLEEAGGVIRSALAVFIENKPVTFWSVDAELDVASDAYIFFVLIGLVLYIANDVAAAVSDLPALEVELVALDGIGHIDSVSVGGGVIVRAEDHALLA